MIHIEGGDITEGGCLDDNVRHAMTKLSHLHCVTNFTSLKRVTILGEEKWRIANIGLPCLDNIYAKEYASKKDRGAFFVIIKAPQGSGFNFTKQKQKKLKKFLYQRLG